MKSRVARIYRYVRFRKGHGVHSPFAFGLINKVIEEKKPYYAFEEIEKKTSRLRLKISTEKKYGRLLYRLVNFFHVQTVLQVGNSQNMRTKYLEAAASHYILVEKDYLSAVDNAIETLGTLDFIFLNISKDAELSGQLFDKCLHHTHHSTVLVLDGIHKKNMRKLWKDIKNRHDVPVTMDLYALGLVFFNRKMHKKNYKLFF